MANWEALQRAAEESERRLVLPEVLPSMRYLQMACEGEEEPSTFVTDLYSKENPNKIMLSLTGFTCSEFEELWTIISRGYPPPGKGRPATIKKKDAFLITLAFFKSYNKVDVLSAYWKCSSSSIERAIKDTIKFCLKPLENTYLVPRAAEEFSGRNTNFPKAVGVIDVTFQQINRPLSSFDEAKVYFSGKHHQYGIKTQVVHDLNGVACFASISFPGSVHDFQIYKETVPSFRSHYMIDQSTTFHELLGDKAYLGSEFVTGPKVIIPFKYSGNRSLTFEQVTHNRNVGSVKMIRITLRS